MVATVGTPSGLTLRELRDKPLGELKSVGAKLAPRLVAMGLVSVLDLLS